MCSRATPPLSVRIHEKWQRAYAATSSAAVAGDKMNVLAYAATMSTLNCDVYRVCRFYKVMNRLAWSDFARVGEQGGSLSIRWAQ